MEKTIAKWTGDNWDYEIALWNQQIVLSANEDAHATHEDSEYNEVAMSRADVMAVIAGLQNALAEMDGFGDETE